jgi:hypothetical protein
MQNGLNYDRGRDITLTRRCEHTKNGTINFMKQT